MEAALSSTTKADTSKFEAQNILKTLGDLSGKVEKFLEMTAVAGMSSSGDSTVMDGVTVRISKPNEIRFEPMLVVENGKDTLLIRLGGRSTELADVYLLEGEQEKAFMGFGSKADEKAVCRLRVGNILDAVELDKALVTKDGETYATGNSRLDSTLKYARDRVFIGKEVLRVNDMLEKAIKALDQKASQTT